MVTLVRHDLEFILQQILVAEQHASGTPLSDLVDSPLLPTGLRTVDGSFNNILPGREQWGASGQPFINLVTPNFGVGEGSITFGAGPGAVTISNSDYGTNGANNHLADAQPRTISNLIVDQTLNNPAAIITALSRGGMAGADLLAAQGEISAAFAALKAAEAAAANPATDAAILALQGQITVLQGQIAALEALLNGGPTDAVFMGIIANLQGDVADLETQIGILQASAPEAEALIAAQEALDTLLADNGIEMSGPSIVIANIAPDEGLSSPYNSIFTLFGQFFDHGLDLVAKGGNGTIYMPLLPDDPLYVEDSPTNFMAVTRVTLGDGEANVVTPWVDQNQTYTSNASHQVFLREYAMSSGGAVSTGHLLEGVTGGLATWADVKAHVLEMLGIRLTDKDIGMVPVVAVDPYGNFIPGPNGYAQLMVGLNGDGTPIYMEGTADGIDPSVVGAFRTGIAFLDDIAHLAAPKTDVDGNLLADADDAVGYAGGFDTRGNNTTYDNEMLDRHFITGDGRGNENIGLTAIHHLFHAEHNRVVEHVKAVVLATGDAAFIAEWQLPDGSWNGERLFQAARFTTEMEYQHLVFEEFARKIQPDVDIFVVQPDPQINPAIFAEFAHVIYRFGHSMLNETVDRVYADGSRGDMTLFDAFLNPIAFDNDGTLTAEQAAGAIIRGMTGQVGNEIDEFVTNVLRNQLVGIPLDLAAINIARGRDTGMPTLNEARAQFQELAYGDTQLAPYTSWSDFALNMQNPASLVNFIAAYGTHETILAATTIEGKRDAAMALVFGGDGAPSDRLAFLNGPAATTGVNDIDLWVGGLAEKKMPFGGMLGTTFAFVFELQMENLQDGDRFYYLSRTQGLNLLVELENNSLAKIAMRNTDLGETMFGLPMDVFANMDHTFYVDPAQQAALGSPDPVHDNPFLAAVSQLVERGPNYIRYNGYDHVAIAGTEGNDTIIGGNGDDALWGFGGDDRIEAGEGVDNINGGAGDDILTKIGAPAGETAVFKGESGNDVIHGGAGLPLIFGGSGKDFLMTGADGGEIRAGEDDDFVLGGEGQDVLFGNQGDDWIEAGLRADYIAGDMGELFFNSTVIGHDVMNGGQGDTDYDADSGDDIMFAGEGIQKFIGMWGHDWVTHQGLEFGQDADMNVEVFTTLPLEVLRDRYSQVEAVSGWHNDDILRGDNRSFDGGAAIADPTPEGNFMFNELDQAGIDRIRGLDQLITPDMMQMMQYWADGSGTEKLAFAHGNIILGGGGSDVIEGRAGDDVIDGDAYLNVRVAIHAWNPDKTPVLNGDGSPVILGSVQSINGSLTLGGVTKTLPQWMLDGTINPGQLHIVREILYSDSGEDTSVYWDVVDNYTIIQRADGRLTIDHVTQSVGDLAVDPVTGRARLSDGTDTLGNIERLQFAGLTIDTAQSAATGQPVLSSQTPAVGEALSADLAGIQDANGVNTATFAFQWQEFVGGSWTNIAGATEATYTVLAAQQTVPIRVVVSFTDYMGNAETVTSEPTTPIYIFNGGPGADTAVGTAGPDIMYGNNGNDNLSGLGGNDSLFGGNQNDTLNGGAGDDELDGGTGTDRAVFSGSVANFSFALDGTTVVVTDNTGVNGTDRLTSIEEAQFSEGVFTLRLGTNGNNNNIGGNNGADLLLGFAGNDTLNASGGNDVLVGGAGNDALNGGAGNDTYLFGLSDGTDTITDGSGNGTADRIVIQANGAELSTLSAHDSNIGTANGNLVLGFDGQQITVAGHYTGTNTQTGVEQISFGNASYAGYALGNGTYAISRDDSGTRSGTGGNDLIAGEIGQSNTLSGGNGNDLMFAGGVGDILNGDAGNDLLVSGAGNDVINGGTGDDTIVWRAGNGRDIVDGGTGTDTFFAYGNATAEQFTIWTRAEWLNVAGNTAAQLNAETAIIVTRNGSATANVIAELRNVEEIVIRGLGGGDTFNQVGDFTGTGLSYNTITIVGGDGDDTIDISSLQSDHRVVFRSTGGNDRLIGSLRPQDVIVLATGAVMADYAEAANDDGTTTLAGAGHSITFTGAPRIATADEVIGDYEAAAAASEAPEAPETEVEVETPEAAEAPEPATSAAPSVQFGTAGKDAMIGGDGRDILFGDAGNDDILAGDGADMAFGDEGDDRIFGQGGDDYLNAGAGNDTVFGGDGNDVIVAQVGDGNDVYYGDDGSDTLDMSAITANITANLGTGHMERGFVSSAQTGQDVIWSIENIITGSGDDVITASGAVNIIDGGEGNDTFRFLSASDADGDTIVTFNPGDRLDLSAIDAHAGTAGNQSFTIVSGGLTGPGQLMITLAQMDGQDVTLVQGKTTEGDEVDFTIKIKGAHDLTASDFSL